MTWEELAPGLFRSAEGNYVMQCYSVQHQGKWVAVGHDLCRTSQPVESLEEAKRVAEEM